MTHRTQTRLLSAVQVQLMRQIEKSQREWADGRRQRDKEILQLRRKARLPSIFNILLLYRDIRDIKSFECPMFSICKHEYGPYWRLTC